MGPTGRPEPLRTQICLAEADEAPAVDFFAPTPHGAATASVPLRWPRGPSACDDALQALGQAIGSALHRSREPVRPQKLLQVASPPPTCRPTVLNRRPERKPEGRCEVPLAM